MSDPAASEGEKLPDDIADLVVCWTIDFATDKAMESWAETRCVSSMKKRMAPYLAHQAKLLAENAALRQQLSEAKQDAGRWQGQAEMWRQRAELAERRNESDGCVTRMQVERDEAREQLKQQGDRLAAAETVFRRKHDHWFELGNGDKVAIEFYYPDEKPEGCWRVNRRERLQCYRDSLGADFDTAIDAYLAAVAANWLPAETADVKGGE
jgi:hypothetical protein